MLSTIIIILVVLWALGFFGGFVAGNVIHALLVIALILLIVRIISGRRVI